MIKDTLTAFLLVLFGLLGKIFEWCGAELKYQALFYELGVSLLLVTLCVWAVTEVRGNRVYIWLALLFLSAMNPVNLIFIDYKLPWYHVVISYILAAWIVFLYKKYK